SSGDEHPIEIPDREPIVLDIQFRVIKNRQLVQRIGVGDQMATNSKRIDQLNHAGFLECLFANSIFRKKEWIAIEIPTHRRVRNPEIQKDIFVKIVLPDDELVHAREK